MHLNDPLPGYLLYQGARLVNVTSMRTGAAAAQSTVAVRLSRLPLGAFLGRAIAVARARVLRPPAPVRVRQSFSRC